MLVVQSLKIVDRYGKRDKQKQLPNNIKDEYSFADDTLANDITGNLLEGDCLDKSSMISGAVIFLAAQLMIVILFALIWRRNHRANDKGLNMLESPTGSRADPLSYMYESGFARRLQ